MKINELEDLLGVSKATIRYYEDQGLVTPPRMDNYDLFNTVLRKAPPDGCYAVTVQDAR